MTARLIKHDDPIARDVMLRLVVKAKPLAAKAPPEPSAEEQEISRLQAQVATLTAERDLMLAEWDAGLEAAQASAKSEAAREHVANDERRTAALKQSLTDARQQFEDMLAAGVEPLAAQLAARAFAQLAALREGDEDWLGQVIAQRLKGIAAGSVVALHLAPDDTGNRLTAVLQENALPAELVKSDPALKSGTARIELQLGEIEIDPKEGTNEILRLLERAGAELG